MRWTEPGDPPVVSEEAIELVKWHNRISARYAIEVELFSAGSSDGCRFERQCLVTVNRKLLAALMGINPKDVSDDDCQKAIYE